jgi:beta-N-acetylhexosaminidase
MLTKGTPLASAYTHAGASAIIGTVEERMQRRRRRDLVRRRRLRLAVGAAVALVVGAIVGAATGDGERSAGDMPAPTREAPPAAEAEAAVDQLTLAQQVGRMVILRFAGTRAPGYVREVLREGRAAGAILFRDNVVSPAQLRALTRQLRRADPDALISVDQEGGAIRIVPWAAPERSAPEQAAAGTVGADARAAGGDLRAAGIDVTLAPVADVPSADSALAGRGFATDPERAAAAVAESVRGWREAGVATTIKHFPGLGGATVNTDDGPATVERTRAQLDDDLKPFRAGIRAGTEFVMASHATYPALDREHIASQSPAIIDGLLRRELGFDGVVMTDSLEAAAVLAVADVEEAALASARAGVDVILTTGRGSYIRVYRALLAKARSHRAFRARVRAAAARVLDAQSSGDG